MRSVRSLLYAKHTLPQSEQVLLFQRSLARRQMSFADAAVTAESSVRPQGVRDVWVGLTVWLPNTAAVCRVLRMLPLLFWMYWDIWMRSLSVSVMRSTEKLPLTSP